MENVSLVACSICLNAWWEPERSAIWYFMERNELMFHLEISANTCATSQLEVLLLGRGQFLRLGSGAITTWAIGGSEARVKAQSPVFHRCIGRRILWNVDPA